MKVKVSDVITNYLADQGIKHVFGIIGSGSGTFLTRFCVEAIRKSFPSIMNKQP